MKLKRKLDNTTYKFIYEVSNKGYKDKRRV